MYCDVKHLTILKYIPGDLCDAKVSEFEKVTRDLLFSQLFVMSSPVYSCLRAHWMMICGFYTSFILLLTLT